ncbi:MAG: 16S rRNA (guanine(527)-N(7))-methyltransferase RsmG [Flavobacteriales bacterium]|nr:16S rRNA (guanine(527)-N(7))-methyltransferase RsmG [Flavobacteriales bacterium]
MYTIEKIISLFPHLNSEQKKSIEELERLYSYWNERVNLISRKDMQHFYNRHVLHSLSIGLYFNLNHHSVLDVGTGGGFPGVPLAILFPNAQFTLVDSIGKKLNVVNAVADELDLKNIITKRSRIEDLKGKYDFLTGRAVKSLPQIMSWSEHLVNWNRGKENSGMLYLKGGDFKEELKGLNFDHTLYDLSKTLKDDPFFETKKLVHLYQTKSNPAF